MAALGAASLHCGARFAPRGRGSFCTCGDVAAACGSGQSALAAHRAPIGAASEIPVLIAARAGCTSAIGRLDTKNKMPSYLPVRLPDAGGMPRRGYPLTRRYLLRRRADPRQLGACASRHPRGTTAASARQAHLHQIRSLGDPHVRRADLRRRVEATQGQGFPPYRPPTTVTTDKVGGWSR